MRLIHRALALLLCALVLGGCGLPRRAATLPAGDAELARLNNSARAAFDSASMALAARLYEQALTRARAIDEPAAIGNAAYNLAACRIALGEYDAAHSLLSEARSELTRARNNVADVLLLEAKLAHWQGRRDDALRFAQQLLSNSASTPAPAHRAEMALLKGQLACDEGDIVAARSALAEAARHASISKDDSLRANREKLSGRIHLLDNQPAAAAEFFDREAALWQQIRQPGEMSHALARAGDAWRAAGKPAMAAERFLRAARSSFAQGEQPTAAKWIALSHSLAVEARDESLVQRAQRLQSEITKSSARPGLDTSLPP